MDPLLRLGPRKVPCIESLNQDYFMRNCRLILDPGRSTQTMAMGDCADVRRGIFPVARKEEPRVIPVAPARG